MTELMSRKIALRKYVSEIASALGEGWYMQPVGDDEDLRWPRLMHREGYGIWFGTTSKSYAERDRDSHVTVGPVWPLGLDGREVSPYFSEYLGQKRPETKFARSKTPVQAAADIARRFLPVYLPRWVQERDSINARRDARNRQTQLATEIARVIGGKVTEDRQGDSQVTVRAHDMGEPAITEVSFGHAEAVILRVALRDAADVAAILGVLDALKRQ